MCFIIATNGDQQLSGFDLCVVDLLSAAVFGRIAACIGTDVHLWLAWYCCNNAHAACQRGPNAR